MSTLIRLAAVLAIGALGLIADVSLAPSLQWVQTLGGSGANQVNAAAADSRGNLYITGSTTSIDFPVTSPALAVAGGSPLYRINTATGAAQTLYPAGLSALTSIAPDPQTPQILYASQANNIWRSGDSGNTWTSLSALPPGVTARLAIDPLNTSVIYAAASPKGVFKSSDGGQSWTAANSGIPTDNSGALNVYFVWSDPKVPRVVFAA